MTALQEFHHAALAHTYTQTHTCKNVSTHKYTFTNVYTQKHIAQKINLEDVNNEALFILIKPKVLTQVNKYYIHIYYGLLVQLQANIYTYIIHSLLFRGAQVFGSGQSKAI